MLAEHFWASNRHRALRDVSHDRITRFLSQREYSSQDLWLQVKSTVRHIEQSDGVLIFDDTIQEKAWTDENDIMCRHFDHVSGGNFY